MINELEKTYEIVTEITNLDQRGYLKPSGYQLLINKMIEEHLKSAALDFDHLAPFGLSWVIVSLSIDIKKPILGCQKLQGTTWHAQRKGIIFRREMEMKDTSGEVVFNASMFSVLFDIKSRSIFKQKELPFSLGEPTTKFLLEASPSFRGKHQYVDVHHRCVYRSHIDCLGHVNNCRYGEFAFDTLSEVEAEMERVKRIDIYFISELRPEDTFITQKVEVDDRIIIRGYNKTQDKVSFHSVFTY